MTYNTGSTLLDHLAAERDRIRAKWAKPVVIIACTDQDIVPLDDIIEPSQCVWIEHDPIDAPDQLPEIVERKPITIAKIQCIVARHFDISRDDMLSDRRTSSVIHARHVAMYLAKILTPRSYPYIGHAFGGRDHTTAMHGVRKMEAKIKENEEFAREIDRLKETIKL